MAENTKIEWCDHTFNPWIGCQKVSPGCDHCYAESMMADRLKQVGWGPHADRKRTSAANWRLPLKWNRQAEAEGKRARVFCASLADVFDNHRSIQYEWRADLWELIRQTPHLDWLLLTKRTQNIIKYLPEDWGNGYPNVWLGTTVENQEEANRRVEVLLHVPAKVRFLSCEPLLGHVRLDRLEIYDVADRARYERGEQDSVCGYYVDALTGHVWDDENGGLDQEVYGRTENLPHINWVICGGESGTNARPMHPDWARSLRDQCKEAGTAFFMKQWGSWSLTGMLYDDDNDDPQGDICMSDDGYIWEDDVQPSVRGRPCLFDRISKKAAGRHLDGVLHNEFPEASE